MLIYDVQVVVFGKADPVTGLIIFLSWIQTILRPKRVARNQAKPSLHK